MKRFLGAEMLLIGLMGLVFCVAGGIYGLRTVDHVGRGLGDGLTLASQSLDTTTETLLLAKASLGDMNESLDTVETTAIHLSQGLTETRPLLADIGQIVSRDMPASVEALQAAVEDMAQAASTIDDTLQALSDLSLEQQVAGIPLRLELNLGYAPAVSFEESVSGIGSSLERVPSQLRGFGVHIGTMDGNLDILSQDVLAMSADVDAISNRVDEVSPLLDEYIRSVAELSGWVGQAQAGLSGYLDRAKLVLIVVMVWMSLMQVAPLYLGWELVSGQRSVR
jgi:outer membrane murein-binding lipoprotein Lpp